MPNKQNIKIGKLTFSIKNQFCNSDFTKFAENIV